MIFECENIFVFLNGPLNLIKDCVNLCEPFEIERYN